MLLLHGLGGGDHGNVDVTLAGCQCAILEEFGPIAAILDISDIQTISDCGRLLQYIEFLLGKAPINRSRSRCLLQTASILRRSLTLLIQASLRSVLRQEHFTARAKSMATLSMQILSRIRFAHLLILMLEL